MPRGGKRDKAGRPPGRPNKVTRELKRHLVEVAREHTAEALDVLLQIAREGNSEGARVTAACAILDRGWGRPIAATDYNMIPLRAVLELTERMGQVVAKNVSDKGEVERVASAWMKIDIKV